MSDMKVFNIPDNGNNSVPAWLPFLNQGNNGILGGNGWGGGILGFLLGLMFGNGGIFGGNGFFGGGNRGGAGTAYLGNMISNDNGRDLLMQAITNQGEMSRNAVQQLATSLGQDFTIVNGAIQTITTSLNQIANAQGMNAMQVINAIQSGNCQLGSQLQQCCCQNQMAIMQQTNTLQNGLNGVQQSIASKAAADQLSTCQQTYTLTDTMNRNYLALDNKIDAMESARKDREITALTAKVAQLESQNFTTQAIGQALAPVNGQLYNLNQTVESIKRCQPPVRTLVDNSFTAVPTVWANAVADNIVDRISAALTPATTPATAPAAVKMA